MPTFEYKPRSLREVVVRTVQTHDEIDRAPQIAPEEKCARCGCARWMHCYIRRAAKNRSTLWVLEYGLPNNRQIVWERTGGLPRRNSGLRPVRCKHYQAGEDFPCCNSAACSTRSCDCVSFRSPFLKPRVKKPAAPKSPRKKRATKTKEQAQFDFSNQAVPATPLA